MFMKTFLAASLGLILPSQAIDFQAKMTKAFQDQRGTETGDEEYTMVAQIKVDGYTGPSTCIQCNSGGDCTSTGTWADSGRLYTSGTSLNIAFTAWENDIGDRCKYETDFFNSDDDRVTGNCYITMTNYVSTAGWHTAHCIHTDAYVQVQFKWWPDPTPAPPTPSPHYCTVDAHNCDAQHAECFLRDGVHNEYHCECSPNYVCVSGCDWPFVGHTCHRTCEGFDCPNAEWVRPQDVACSGTTVASCDEAVCCPHTDAPSTPSPTTDAPPTPTPHDCSTGAHSCDVNANCFIGTGGRSDYICVCGPGYICEHPSLEAGCTGRCLRSCEGYVCTSGVQFPSPREVKCGGTDEASCDDSTCCLLTPSPHQCDSGSHTCDANSVCHPGNGGIDDYVCICKDFFVCEENTIGQGCPGRCLRSCFGYNCANGAPAWAEPAHVACSGPDFSSCSDATCCPTTPTPSKCDSGSHTCDDNAVCHPGQGVDDYVCICKQNYVCELDTIGQGCGGRCLRSCDGYTCPTGVHWPEPAHVKCSGTDFSSCSDAECCPYVCGAGVRTTAVGGVDAVDIQPQAITNNELDITHTHYTQFPSELSSMSAYPLPRPVPTGTKVHLKCCDGETCAFAVALYRCTDCTGPMPFGMTQQLLLDNWDSASCSPYFDAEFATSLFYKTVTGPFDRTFEVQHDELFIVLMKSGGLPVPLCDKPHGPFTPSNCGVKCPTI